MEELITTFQLPATALGHLTSAVQFGFIAGTLLFAIFTIADRFSPSKVFCISAVFGALFNTLGIWEGHSLESLLVLRFAAGFFLAGIYPVGMKIATDYYNTGLGKSLGYLVGALVLGTAFPHLLKGVTTVFSWETVLLITSLLALIGGVLMVVLVPNGPYRRAGVVTNFAAFLQVFKERNFRSAAFGYFGHMWELYTFWAFVPVFLTSYVQLHPNASFNLSVLSFLTIGIGSISCVVSGYLANRWGNKQIAFLALLCSCVCCIVSPLAFAFLSPVAFLSFLFFWGVVVVADSPLFSTLVAQNAPPEIKGTALTIVNCIGFSVTIISLQVVTALHNFTTSYFIYTSLALGPILGLILFKMKENKA